MSFHTEPFLHVSGLQDAGDDMKQFMCDRECVSKGPNMETLEPQKSRSGRKKRRRACQGSRRMQLTPRKLFHDDVQKENQEEMKNEKKGESDDQEPEEEDMSAEEEQEQEDGESECHSEGMSEDKDVFSKRWKLTTPPPKSQSSKAPPSAPKKTPSHKSASPEDETPGSARGMQEVAGMMNKVDKRLREILPHRIAVCLVFHDACSLSLLQLFIHAEGQQSYPHLRSDLQRIIRVMVQEDLTCWEDAVETLSSVGGG